MYHNYDDMAISEPIPRAPGRPRNEVADRKIIEATLRLLSTEGYDRTSIESVAAEAHVTRATVYRRYPTKADMVTALAEAFRRHRVENLNATLVSSLDRADSDFQFRA